MALDELRARTGPASLRGTLRLAVMAFVAQAVVAVVVWLLVDDKSGGTFSNDDIREWAAISVVLGGLIVALAGTRARRSWVAASVAAGCVLAMALGCTVFVGYAVANSA